MYTLMCDRTIKKKAVYVQTVNVKEFLSNVQFIPGKNRQNRLLINNGNGVFSDATSSHLPVDADDTLDAIFEDVDGDGFVDLIIANVNLQTSTCLKAYLNDSQGHFKDKSNEGLIICKIM